MAKWGLGWLGVEDKSTVREEKLHKAAVSEVEQCIIADSLLGPDKLMTDYCQMDPMWEEANPQPPAQPGDGRSVPMVLQCSVVPPATKRALLLSQCSVGIQMGSTMRGVDTERSTVHSEVQRDGDGEPFAGLQDQDQAMMARGAEGAAQTEDARVAEGRVPPCKEVQEWGSSRSQANAVPLEEHVSVDLTNELVNLEIEQVVVPPVDQGPEEFVVGVEPQLAVGVDHGPASEPAVQGRCMGLSDLPDASELDLPGKFDLNLAPAGGEDEGSLLAAVITGDRPILGVADNRLNKDSRAASSSKGPFRGVTRLAVPLKKSLLCAPMGRSKSIPSRKAPSSDVPAAANANHRGGCSSRCGSVMQAVKDKATMVLICVADANAPNTQPTDEMKQNFYGQFTDAMHEGLVANMRQVFGLAADGSGCLAVLTEDVEP